MSRDVFISYSHRDQKAADAACARLEQAGYRCWIAPRDIGAGEWGKSIIEGIRASRVFVLIFSGNANRSPQVNREVERAVSNGLPIIPVRVEDVKPSDSLEYFISNQHWLDALTPPLERHLERLIAMVGHLLDGPAAPEAIQAVSAATRRSATRWWGGGAVLAAAAAFILWQAMAPAGPAAPLPAPPPVSSNTVPRPAPVPADHAWLYGRWCVDGNRENVQTVSGEGNRIVIAFSGQRQIETIRESAPDSVTTDVATYRRTGSSVAVTDPYYSFRLEACR